MHPNSSSRRARSSALAIAGIAMAGTLPAAAGAATPRHVGGVGTGVQPTTVGPDLRSVTIDPTNNLTDDIGERARYCFDSAVTKIGTGFVLMGYDARRYWTGTGAPATDNPNCIVVTFAKGADIAQATVGQVGAGAATDVSGKANIVASEPVTGSAVSPVAGATTGPDLTSVTVDATDANHKIVTYTFDESLNPNPTRPDGPDADNPPAPEKAYQRQDFGYVLQDGAPVLAPAGNVQPTGNAVKVDFGTAPVDSAVRFITQPNAVEDVPASAVQAGSGLTLMTPSSPGVIITNPQTGGHPDVKSVESAGTNMYKITYTTGVSSPNPAAFQAVADDGTVSAVAASVGTGGTQDSVIVTFPDSEALTKDPGSVVRIISASGAVTNSTDAGSKSIYGQLATQTPNAKPGFTNGPDLLSVAVDPSTQRANFTYDEPVATGTAASAFTGFRADGTNGAAQGTTTSSGSTITVNLGAGIGDYVAFGQGYRAVTDPIGRPSPNQSVGKDIETASIPVTPPPVTPPVTPPAAAGKKKAKTTVTFRRIGKRFSGTVSASVTTCKYNRSIILRKKGKSTTRFGTAKSLSNGRWGLTKTKPTKGTYYVFVLAKTTSKYACSSYTSKSTVKIR